MSEEPKEQRQGKTGKWTLVLKATDGTTVLARPEWSNSIYEFQIKQWEELPLIP